MGVTVARVSQIEHGEVTSVKVLARCVETLGGPWTSSPTSTTEPSACPSATLDNPPSTLVDKTSTVGLAARSVLASITAGRVTSFVANQRPARSPNWMIRT